MGATISLITTVMVVGQRLELNSYLTWLKTYGDPNPVCAHK